MRKIKMRKNLLIVALTVIAALGWTVGCSSAAPGSPGKPVDPCSTATAPAAADLGGVVYNQLLAGHIWGGGTGARIVVDDHGRYFVTGSAPAWGSLHGSQTQYVQVANAVVSAFCGR
jgi:hypothetical protein